MFTQTLQVTTGHKDSKIPRLDPFISSFSMQSFKETIKKKKQMCRQLLQNGLCKITFLRMIMLPTTYTFAGPAFQKCCKNTRTAGLPHDTAAA